MLRPWAAAVRAKTAGMAEDEEVWWPRVACSSAAAAAAAAAALAASACSLCSARSEA